MMLGRWAGCKHFHFFIRMELSDFGWDVGRPKPSISVSIEAIAYNMVIDGLCKEMKLEEAEKFLELKNKQEYARDVYGYSYLIRSYCKNGKHNEGS